MTDLTRLTISESLNKLKAKEISPVELTEAYIKKLEDVYAKSGQAGVKAIKLEDGERAVGMAVVPNDDAEIIVLTEKGFGKRTKAASFKVKGRNTKGVKYMNITTKSGNPVALSVCSASDDLVVVTDKGMIIRTELKRVKDEFIAKYYPE